MINIREGAIGDFTKLNQDWAWAQASWQREAQKNTIEAIKAGTQSFLVIEDEKDLIGEIHIQWDRPKDHEMANGINRAYVFALRIHPDRRKEGLGTKLMQATLRFIKSKKFTEATVGAYKDEVHLKALYQEKWGFTEFVKDVLEETDEYSKYFELYLQKL